MKRMVPITRRMMRRRIRECLLFMLYLTSRGPNHLFKMVTTTTWGKMLGKSTTVLPTLMKTRCRNPGTDWIFLLLFGCVKRGVLLVGYKVQGLLGRQQTFVNFNLGEFRHLTTCYGNSARFLPVPANTESGRQLNKQINVTKLVLQARSAP